MRISVLRLVQMALLCVVGLGLWAVGGALPLAGAVVSASVGAPSFLQVPESLDPPFVAAAALTPERVEEDAVSRLRYAGLGSSAALALAVRDFRVDHPAWTPPGGEVGASLGGYLGDFGVVEKLAGGAHAVVSSTVPLRVNNGLGLQPTSFALRDDGEAFMPENPVVPVAISTSVAGGIAFPAGLSVTPVGLSGGAAPAVVGDQVLFANAERDTDVMAEPRPGGAELSWQLRSQESPVEQSLAFNIASGATLQWSTVAPGGVEVLSEGKPVLLVPRASARGADGAEVPVSYSFSGNVLTTHVDLGGSVDFPVLVDPTLLYGYYGEYPEGHEAHVWNLWAAGSSYSGFGGEAYKNLLKMGTNPGAPSGSAGWFEVTTPGDAGKPGSAGITRVDLVGVTHHESGQSRLVTTINESNGVAPDYSWNGTEGASGPLPLYESGNLAGQSIAFCASGAGGHDGGEQPLCNEESYQGHSFLFEDEITHSPQSVYNYVQLEGAKITYRDPAAPNKVTLNDSGYSGEWLKYAPTTWKIESEDEGLGVAKLELQIPAGHSPTFTESSSCNGANGFEGCPSTFSSAVINLSGLGTGAYSLAPVATDAAENVARPEGSYVPLYVDHTAPEIGELTGSLGAAAGGVIGDGNYTLSFDPVDGSTESPQSGVYSVEIKVDGVHAYTDTTSCPSPKGVPAESCFALNGSWIMNGQAYGAGPHTITVTAKDWDGNESSKSFGVTVNEAASAPMGPGAVNVETGDFKLDPTDASIPAGDATLSVSRVYDSRKTIQGAAGPLGPQWLLSLPGSASEEEWQSLTPLPEGSVAATNAHGGELIFTLQHKNAHEATYNSPAGYQTEALTERIENSETEYELSDALGDYTIFTQPSAGAPFVPSSVAQSSAAGGLNKVKYSFTKTSEGITEPTEILGPEPTAGACSPTLVKGCRALTFSYATSTTATGEAPSEWGEYKGRLSKISLTAWEPTKGEMITIAVAQYAWDKQGRLRSEWDPRISPALKTDYGYDSEGHITAYTAPGMQTWAMTYGTAAGDTNLGRLVKAIQAPPATTRWAGEALSNSEKPKLTGSPAIGTTLGVSSGTWSGSPVAMGYRWEDCNATGGECTPIAGANNPNYTVASSDGEHTVVAVVTATNGGGSLSATTPATSVVGTPAAEYTLPAGSAPNSIVLSPEGTLWYTVDGTNKVGTKNTSGVTVTEEASSTGYAPEDLTFPGSQRRPWYDSHDATTNESELTSLNNSPRSYEVKGAPAGVASGPLEEIWWADPGNNTIDRRTIATSNSTKITEYSLPTGSKPKDITEGPSSELWFTEPGTHHIGRITTSGVITQYELPAGSEPDGITEGPEKAMWFVDHGTNKVGKITTAGALSEYSLPAGSGPSNITVGPDEALWSTDTTSSKIARITTAGTVTAEYALPTKSEPLDITKAPDGDLFYTDAGTGKIAQIPTWGTGSVSEGTHYSPAPGWTIDYKVPVSGASAPYQLGSKEVEAWAQKDDPQEATAIFPPDEPQSWPASDYKRATLLYLDSANRTVNTASPSGAISTTEYGQNNNPTRTLTADNREAALKEGSKSAEASKLLDSESTYSADSIELVSSLGSQHTIKLASGSTVLARKHTQFFYDEGSPGGATYHLVTKTIEGASITGEEEQEARTTTTAYSGQENLGWRLHTPTSTTTSTGSRTVTSTTVLEPATGEVTETTPATGTYVAPTFVGHAGSLGSEKGQLKGPTSVALDSKRDAWAVDSANNRVEEFNEAGEWIKTIGSIGTGNGQFESPRGIAINASNEVAVADTGNHRVQIFNEKGEWLRNITTELSAPTALAYSPKNELFVTDTGNSDLNAYSATGTFVKTIATSSGSHHGLQEPISIAFNSLGDVFVDNKGGTEEKLFEYTEEGKEIALSGVISHWKPDAIAVDSAGNLLGIASSNLVEEMTEGGTVLAAFGSSGSGPEQFNFGKYVGIATDSHRDIWISDTENNRIDRWLAPSSFIGKKEAHTTQTIYYTTAANSKYASCGNHPEWAGLPCQEQHAGQPESGLPATPTTTYTYNMWQEPLTVTDTSGATTRTTTLGYDAAARTITSSITSSVDTPLPTVTNEFNKENGSRERQSTTVSGHTKSITATDNTIGQVISYTDAEGNTATFEFEKEGDYRLIKTNDGKGTQTLTYNTTAGFLATLKDSAAGTFTAGHDVEGNITSEGYPDGLTALFTLNPLGEPVNLEYIKASHCGSSCTWFTDAVTPSIHGQWLNQTSSLSTQNYGYNEIGWLAEVQDTPVGKGCTTRLYRHDEDGNRTSETTREPATEGKCATEGGTVQTLPYDTADRLDEPGVEYETWGNTTSLPAADAGGSALSSTYYVNNALASTTQNGQTIGYNLDPAGRPSETIETGAVKATTISHYDGPGSEPAWTSTGSSWARNIPGISGGLAAVQTNGETPILQLANLHGDIIATAALSETETKLLSTSDTTEYGVPRASSPPKYSWLGTDEVPTELATGFILMGARGYIPQLGRFEQADPQPGGSINSYAYTDDDPVNQSDPSGEATTTTSYNLEAAQTGEAQAGLAQTYTGPGAILPPPVNMQIQDEFVVHPPWGAATAYSECTGSGACTASICSEWPYCSTLSKTLMDSTSPAAPKVRAPSCTVSFDGIKSTCQQVLERAKAEYSADNKHACSEGVNIVSGFIGGNYFGFFGALIGDKIVGRAVGNAVCQ